MGISTGNLWCTRTECIDCRNGIHHSRGRSSVSLDGSVCARAQKLLGADARMAHRLWMACQCRWASLFQCHTDRRFGHFELSELRSATLARNIINVGYHAHPAFPQHLRSQSAGPVRNTRHDLPPLLPANLHRGIGLHCTSQLAIFCVHRFYIWREWMDKPWCRFQHW